MRIGTRPRWTSDRLQLFRRSSVKRYSLALLAAVAAVGLGASSVSAGQTNAQGNTANLQPVRVAQAIDDAAGRFRHPAIGRSPDSVQRPSRLHQTRSTQRKPRSRRTRARQRNPRPAALDVRTDGCDRFVRSRFEDGRRHEARLRRQGDGRQTGSRSSTANRARSTFRPKSIKASVVVPVRVISEGMGAYVQWVPEKKVVVVRYVAAPVPTPPPPPPATAAADAAADPAADAAAAAARRRRRRLRRRRSPAPRAPLREIHRRRLHLQADRVQPVLERHEHGNVGSVIRGPRGDRIPVLQHAVDDRRLRRTVRLHASRRAPAFPFLPQNANCVGPALPVTRRASRRSAGPRQRVGTAVPGHRWRCRRRAWVSKF